MKNMVIGIEGLVGSGKTSICKELLGIIPNSIIFHGGNLYRGIVYAFIKQKRSLESLKNKDIIETMNELKVKIEVEDRQTVVYVDDKKIDEEKLQSKENSIAVSKAASIANNKELFLFAREIINTFKEKYNVIVSGRALMEIYPDLDYHFFITASIDERVKRKAKQYNSNTDLKELKEHIEKRDKLQEKTGFYKIYPNTIKIDVTECKNVKESTKKVCEHIEEIKAVAI